MATTQIDGTRQIKASSITNSVQNFGTPSASTDVAIKSYVDSVAQGLSAKPSAAAATTAALSPTNTYSAGVLSATGNGTLTVDGYLTALNDYILVMNEASGLKNGLYKVTTAGTAGVPYVLTRAVEMDVSSEFTGAFVFVEQGTTNASSGWVCTNIAPTVGTTAITFTQFSGAGEITAGNGLTKTGNTIDVVGTANRISVAADSIDISSSYVGQATITTVGTIATGTWTGTTIAVLNGGTGVTTSTGSTSVVLSNSPTLVTPILGVASATSLATSAASPFLLTNGQLVTIALTSQTVGATTLTIPNFASVADTFVFTTLAQTLSNKTFVSPALGTPASGVATNLTGTASGLTSGITLALKSATTTVDVSAATAPTLNQVLTATDSTHATWQTLSSSTYSRSTAVSGTQDGANKVFTIANAVSSGSEQVFLNGQLLAPGSSNDYVISSTTVTFQSGFTAPASTDVIRVYGVY